MNGPFLHIDIVEYAIKVAPRHHDCMEPVTSTAAITVRLQTEGL